MVSQNGILDALRTVKYPGYSRDIVSFGLVREVKAANGAVSVSLQLTSANPEAAQRIKGEIETVLKGLSGVKQVDVDIKMPAAGQPPAGKIPSITRPGSPASSASSPWRAARAA
jgi:ATP-binding protein involved in chromosome partitioning